MEKVVRARAKSRREPQAFSASLWKAIFGNHQSAAILRKWLFLSGALLAILLSLINAPADFAKIIEWLFSAPNLGHLIVVIFALWLGLRTAAGTQVAIFDVQNQKTAQNHILQSAYGVSSPLYFVEDQDRSTMEIGNPLESLGGPGRLQLPMEKTAILESSDGFPRVIGPTEKGIPLESFERLRMLLDLRDQVLNIDFWTRTRDGIRVFVQGARLVFSIARGKQEASLRVPYPFSKQAAIRIMKSQKIDHPNVERDNSVDKLTELGILGSNFFEQQLQSFIGEFWLGELLAAPQQSAANEEDASVLFIARDAIRKKFVEQCRKSALEIGLQLHWIDIGTWKVDNLAQEILQDYQQENSHNLAFQDDTQNQDYHTEELIRLFGELVKYDPEEFSTDNNEQLHAEMVSAYYGLFDALKLRYGDFLGEDEPRLDILLRFLKVLANRLEKDGI